MNFYHFDFPFECINQHKMDKKSHENFPLQSSDNKNFVYEIFDVLLVGLSSISPLLNRKYFFWRLMYLEVLSSIN